MPSSRDATRAAVKAGLSRSAAIVFGYLAFWYPKATYEHAGRLWTFATRATLQDEAFVSEKTIDRAIVELERAGLIERKSHTFPGTMRRTTLFLLTEAGKTLSEASMDAGKRGVRRRSGGGDPVIMTLGIEAKRLRADRPTDARKSVFETPSGPTARRDACRQTGGPFYSEIDEEQSEVISSSPTRRPVPFLDAEEKKRRLAFPTQQGETSELYGLLTAKIEASGEQVWPDDAWTAKALGSVLRYVKGKNKSAEDFAVEFSLMLQHWSEIKQFLPNTYREYPDNVARPSAKCLGDQVGVLSKALQRIREREEEERRIAREEAEREAEFEAHVEAASIKLIEGLVCYNELSRAVAREAHARASALSPEYRDRAEREERNRRVLQIVKELGSRQLVYIMRHPVGEIDEALPLFLEMANQRGGVDEMPMCSDVRAFVKARISSEADSTI